MKAVAREGRFLLEREGILGPLLLLPAVVYIIALVGFPLVLAVLYAFSEVTVGSPHITSLKDFVGFANFTYLFGTATFGAAVRNTITIVVVTDVLKLGIGLVARTQREGDNTNDYQLPGFTRWRALAAYGWGGARNRFNLQLNVDNLFNTRYFESLGGTTLVMPACPRRWLVSFRAEL